MSVEDTSMSPSVLRTIGQYLKHLEELNFFRNENTESGHDEGIRSDAAFVCQLSSLKKLRTDSDSVPIPAVLNALVAGAVPIENLELWLSSQSIQDGAIKCIWQLKRIKSLRLTTGCFFVNPIQNLTDLHIIGLGKHLQELEELQLKDVNRAFQFSTIGLRKMLIHATKLKFLQFFGTQSIKINVDDYNAMLNTVQKRKAKVPLVIEMWGDPNQVNVPAEFLAENQETLNVKMIRSS